MTWPIRTTRQKRPGVVDLLGVWQFEVGAKLFLIQVARAAGMIGRRS